ncbi:MAG: hypothetical protein ACI4XF_00345 [Oscillospiraceae bacterium]
MSTITNKERYEQTVRSLFLSRILYDYERDDVYASTADPLYQQAVKNAVARVHSRLSLIDFVTVYAEEFNKLEVPLRSGLIDTLSSHIYRLWDSIQTLF